MLPNVTPAVARAVELAQQLARAAGALDVQPLHLLLALLQEEEGGAALLLARAGLDLAAVRARPEALTTGTNSIASASGLAKLAFSASGEKCLAHARQLASEWGDERLVNGELLAAALVQEEVALQRLLEAHGLNLDKLNSELQAHAVLPLALDEPLDLATPTEQIDVARVLDAAANRAREALRVLEDYTRFALDDIFLSRALKELRHDLTQCLAGLPASLLLAARETLRDVGTTVRTASEERRHSPTAVVQANVKRLQEALRSLEEFGKLHGPLLGRALAALRYRSYTLERALLLGADARQRLAAARLYVLLSGKSCTAALDWTIKEAAAGGASLIQLREKEMNDRRLLERALLVRRWTREAGVLFILNDRPDIARLVEADGVHLGQDDLSVKEARRILGPNALVGVSTHNLVQLWQAVLDGASYVGVGPTFPSATKSFEHLAGLEFVRQAAAETTLPAFVLGGIDVSTIGEAVAAGARRVAVSHAVCAADDPRAAATALCRALVGTEIAS